VLERVGAEGLAAGAGTVERNPQLLHSAVLVLVGAHVLVKEILDDLEVVGNDVPDLVLDLGLEVVLDALALGDVEEVVDQERALLHALLVHEGAVHDVADLLLHVLDRVTELIEIVVPVGGVCVEDVLLLLAHLVQLHVEVLLDLVEVLFDLLALCTSEAGLLLDDELRDALADLLQVVAAPDEILHLSEHVILALAQLLPVEFLRVYVLLALLEVVGLVEVPDHLLGPCEDALEVV